MFCASGAAQSRVSPAIIAFLQAHRELALNSALWEKAWVTIGALCVVGGTRMRIRFAAVPRRHSRVAFARHRSFVPLRGLR